MTRIRLAIDIGGTFTDVVLDRRGRQFTTKVLTTPSQPADAVLTGVAEVLAAADTDPCDVELVVHGTTLATNALIERRGARTALVTTAGHRDALEMAQENRFEQYDVNIDRPAPLVPRALRFTVPERLDARGHVLLALDESAVHSLLPRFDVEGIESVAIGLIHGYANPVHEQRIAAIIGDARPDLVLSLSSDVCPEIREYERLSTTVANAYVKPLMGRYLSALATGLAARGLCCPCLLMTSGGGLTTLETAARYPIRLVESGPAGGAILAAHLASELGLGRVLSFDMGGTTAKICLIDDGEPLYSRAFEVDRSYRFRRGSGLPIRIPVVEMVEIGAGGGSMASVDALERIRVGPESAGSEPGPAAYGRGGEAATITDADVVLGRIDGGHFAGGRLTLDTAASANAIRRTIAHPLGIETQLAAFGISEVVDENMAAAARAHAVEWGKDTSHRTLIAFGGAAPLHAARVASKLGIERVVVPRGAGVGSAIGFLLAPIAYEVVRSRHGLLSAFDADAANEVLDAMRAEARAVVEPAAPGVALAETRRAYMRYVGQGYEIAVPTPAGRLTAQDAQHLRTAFDASYRALYGRLIPGLDIEILSWTLTLATPPNPPPGSASPTESQTPTPSARGQVFDGERLRPVAHYLRERLRPGMRVRGAALVIEDQTTTVVPEDFTASINNRGDIVLERTPS